MSLIRYFLVHRQNRITLDIEPSIDGVGSQGDSMAFREAWDRNPVKPHESLALEEVTGDVAMVNHCKTLHAARNEQIRALRELLEECKVMPCY